MAEEKKKEKEKVGHRATETLAGEHKSEKKHHKVHKMHIRHADGGFIAEHEMEPGQGEGGEEQTPDEHIIPASGEDGTQGLQQHIAQHMGQQPEPQPAPAAAGM